VRTFEYTGGSESIPKNITHVQFHPSVTEVHDEAFKGCNKLNEVVFSDGITKISNGSFKGCTKLKRVVLNNGLKQIGDDSFSGCTSLESITFPSTVTTIGDRAFNDCSSLKQIIQMRNGVVLRLDVFQCCPLEKWKFRLNLVDEVSHLKEIEHKIDEIGSALEVREGCLTTPVPSVDTDENILKVCSVIQYYEVKEATTLVELALWKAKIEQAVGLDRDSCRIELPEPAKNLILQYAYIIPLQCRAAE